MKKRDCDIKHLIMMRKARGLFTHFNGTCGQGNSLTASRAYKEEGYKQRAGKRAFCFWGYLMVLYLACCPF